MHHAWQPFANTRKTHFFSTVGSRGPCVSFHNQCSWCIGIRWQKKTVCYGNPRVLPKTVFVACAHFSFFFKEIYPHFPPNHRYILIIADEDTTVPNQIDVRYGWRVTTPEQWQDLVNNTNIIHIFASHLDIEATDRFSPVPVGFNPEEHPDGGTPDDLLNMDVDLDILNRPLKIVQCCRIRNGEQWKERQTVKKLIHGPWRTFSEYKTFARPIFPKEIQKYSFIFCVHGGGLEPNPKVFTAVYVGTIPIVKRFVNCDILYKDLPVVFVDDWLPHLITPQLLHQWRMERLPYFTTKRSLAVEKLTTDYWIKYMHLRSAEADNSIGVHNGFFSSNDDRAEFNYADGKSTITGQRTVYIAESDAAKEIRQSVQLEPAADETLIQAMYGSETIQIDVTFKIKSFLGKEGGIRHELQSHTLNQLFGDPHFGFHKMLKLTYA